MSVAILVHSKDCNIDITRQCLESLYIHGFPLRYTSFVSTENIDIKDKNFINIKTGDGIWSDRLKIALSNIPKEFDYIIFMLEDMIVKKRESFDVIQNMINIAVDAELDILKFGTNEFFSLSYTKMNIKKYQLWQQKDGAYLLSHQPVSLWKRSFLEESLIRPCTPKEYECTVAEELKARGFFQNRKIICVSDGIITGDTPGSLHGDVIEYHHALINGQYVAFTGN